jgi:catalase
MGTATRLYEPPQPLSGEAAHWDHREDDDYYTQPGNLFRIMSLEQQHVLFGNAAEAIGGAQQFIQIRHIRNCYTADPAYGHGVAAALGLSMPTVNDFEGYQMKKLTGTL